jgi:outer membrane biosynthesis protein TonB
MQQNNSMPPGRVLLALLASLLIHALLLGALEFGHRLGWWDKQKIAALLSPKMTEAIPQPKKEREMQLIFLDVDPSQAALEPPPDDTPFYAARNSLAADSDPRLDLTFPQLDGLQEQIFRATDAPRSLQTRMAEPLTPPIETTPPEPAVAQPPAPAVQPPGDLLMAEKVVPKPEMQERIMEIKPPPRPRTLAAARQQQAAITGQKMRQDGGARRGAIQPSFDAKASLFGEYDEALIAAIQQRWYDLLDERDYVRNRTGKVVLEFRLKSDGGITEMRVLVNEVSEILALICQRAVKDPAPFAPWPGDLRRLVGGDSREVRFTFHYN